MSILQNMNQSGDAQPYRIFRAVIMDVNIDPDTNHKTIFIAEHGSLPEPPYIEADPPSPVSVEGTGSGMQNVPPAGAHCLVYSPMPGNKQFERAQIITYISPPGTPPEGSLNAEPVKAGDYYIKIGGRAKTKFQMTKDGIMSLGGGNFARMEINSQLKAMFFSTKRYKRVNVGGICENEWYEYDPFRDPLKAERTSHYTSHVSVPESPMESDQKMDTEEVSLVPNIRPYVNKAVIKAGKIHNSRQLLDDLATHPYSLDTRNSTGPVPTVKDAVTKLELGFQAGHYPGKGTDFRSPGNLIHWTAKRNIIGNVGTYLMRYGQLENDHGTKVPGTPASTVIPTEFVKGELYRHQVHQGINLGIAPLGVPVIDPVGEGLGWKLEDGGNALESYITSEGKLNSPLLMAAQTTTGGPFQQFNSIYRRHMHEMSIPGTGLFIDEQYGGMGSVPTDPDYYQRIIDQQAGTVSQAMFSERFGQTIAETGATYKLDITDVTQNEHSLWLSPQLTKFESNSLAGVHYGSLVYDHTALTTTLTDGVGPSTSSYMELDTLNGITLNAVTGASNMTMALESVHLDTVAGTTNFDMSGTALNIDVAALTTADFDSVAGINLNAAGGASSLDLGSASSIWDVGSLNNIEIGATSITINAGNSAKITVDSVAGIMIENGAATLEISMAGGVKANGMALLNANVINWLNSMVGMIAVGGMGPSAMSPAGAAQLGAMGALPSHIVPAGFVTGA